MDFGDWLVAHDDAFWTPLGEWGHNAMGTLGAGLGGASGAVLGGGTGNIPGATILGSAGAALGQAAFESGANAIDAGVGSLFGF